MAWTQEKCDDRHRNVNWVIGILFLLLTTILGVNGWLVQLVGNASARADNAARQVEVQAARIEEQRDRVKSDIADLRERLCTIGAKVDRMNDSVQRLVEKTEKTKP